MTDTNKILRRLRRDADFVRESAGRRGRIAQIPLSDEAADEIERLQAKNEYDYDLEIRKHALFCATQGDSSNINALAHAKEFEKYLRGTQPTPLPPYGSKLAQTLRDLIRFDPDGSNMDLPQMLSTVADELDRLAKEAEGV